MKKLGLVVATIAATGVVAVPADAKTQHCDRATFPTRVQVGGDTATVDTNLAEGTTVCIKAGNRIAIVTVGEDGLITNNVIFNQNGKARGISYFAFGSVYTPPDNGGS